MSQIKRLALAGLVVGLVTAATVTVVQAQWPTTCVGANDAFESWLGNDHNVGIYQRVFGYGPEAEEACRNDHRNDVRGAFAWALDTTSSTPVQPANAKSWIEDDTGTIVESSRPDGSAFLAVLCSDGELLIGVLWTGADVPQLSLGEFRATEVRFRYHGHADLVTDSWFGGETPFRGETVVAVIINPLDTHKATLYAQTFMLASGLTVNLPEHGLSADFHLAPYVDSEHPVRRAARMCGVTV
ncbi:MAG: hypothetical protein OXG46_11215 [Chloroflexi bacterium]|nr:hypothetical protein [Chloroflexota bacterium]MCY3938012.1 hypothetical protein [Chloroflexota bacterium]